MNFFIYESNIFVILGSVATYYFDSNPTSEGQANIKLALKWAHTNHVGSIAYGSGIHTLIRLTIEAAMNYAEELRNSYNPAKKAIGYCVFYICIPIEALVEYLGIATYAYAAITGDPYCKSAWNSFLINIKHLT